MTDNPDPENRRPDGERQPATPYDQAGSYLPPMPPEQGYWQPAMSRPGVIPLRPLGVGDILTGAISTMRRYPALMLGVTAVVFVVTELIILAASFPLLDEINRTVVTIDQDTTAGDAFSLFGKSMAVAAIGILLVLVARVFLAGFLTLVVGNAVLGRAQGFGDVWARVRPRLSPLLGLTLVYPAVMIVAGLVVFGLALVVPPLAVLVGIGLVVIGIWLVVLFSLATPALMLEDVGVWTAFGRSMQLVRGSWWRILGITLLGALIAGVVSVIITLPFELAAGGYSMTATEPAMPPASYLVVSTIGAVIASTVTEPFVAAITVLLYTDQRIRRENLGPDLAASAGPVPPAVN
ncbi:MAG TPA: hypothetical protein VH969_19665 [Actinophytocola sp.]|jgi:hypothetical protein|uniref:hypothetical protein n=1 Tax=Actinophytocola sp. TaxID=1872138 RepID=UPI002F94222E